MKTTDNTDVRLREFAAQGLRYLLIVVSFFVLDFWLRYTTKRIGLYDIYELAPNLFTIAWAVLLTGVVTLIPSRLAGRIVYGIAYYVFAIYSVAQNVYFQIFGKFLYFSDFVYAGEAGDYADIVLDVIERNYAIQILLVMGLGVLGIVLFPKKEKGIASAAGKAVAVAAAVVCISLTPKLYGEYYDGNWDSYAMPAFEYENFINSAYDMQLMGIYQYVGKNTTLLMERAGWIGGAERELQRQKVDAFFSEKKPHAVNDMTGYFEGKNVIVVMMESLDDWLINGEDTPAIHYMMENGIVFDNLYTPQYSSGYTFNTEFAFNTGVYPYTNSNAAYALANNDFSLSLAHLFAQKGYRVNSYHRSSPNFYNRGVMHTAFGYEKYNGFYSFWETDVSRENDLFLVRSDMAYGDMVSGEPFMSFVITYSPHLPYDDTDATSQEALALHPEYDPKDEISVLRAKVRLTDDMFAELLQRLEQDGLLQDTVIIGFTDHYAYGLLDAEYLQQVSHDAGNDILENTPFFIYCAGMEDAMVVEKTMQTTDLGPTIANLFGLEVPMNIMGSDVFSEDYMGYALFPNQTWVTDLAYVKDGTLVWNNGMSDEEIAEMSALAQRSYEINDAILDSDYYRYAED